MLMRDPRRWLLAAFLEFRPIPVLLWSYSAVVLGTATALAQGAPFDLPGFAAVLLVATAVQGWTTHAINEIFDWKSGTDRDPSPRLLSGGSRVLGHGILSERGMWILFSLASVVVLAGGAWLAFFRTPLLLVFALAGYGIGIAYTLPPLATAYRPFAGEWLGGFPGVLLAGLGSHLVQAGTVSALAVVALSAHALACVAMLLVHHVLDIPADSQATPRKRTAMVVLGSKRGQAYTVAVAAGSLAAYATAATLDPRLLLAVAFGAGALVVHATIRYNRVDSTTRGELTVIVLGVLAAQVPAILIVPVLAPVGLVGALLFAAHMKVAQRFAPPAIIRRREPSAG